MFPTHSTHCNLLYIPGTVHTLSDMLTALVWMSLMLPESSGWSGLGLRGARQLLLDFISMTFSDSLELKDLVGALRNLQYKQMFTTEE